MKKTLHSNNLFQRIVTVALLISPIIQTYGWGSYDFAFILTSLLAIISLFKYGIRRRYLPKFLLIYFVYWFIVHEITASSVGELVPLGIIRTILVYMMFFAAIEYHYLLKVYKVVAYVSIGFFFFQETVYALSGYHPIGIITSLPLAIDADMGTFIDSKLYGVRSSSFFSEPAHFVQYILPLLCIELFGFSRVKWLRVVIVVAALLLSQSGNALFGIAVIFILTIIRLLKEKKHGVTAFILLPVFLVISLFVAREYIASEMGQRLMERQDQLDSSGGSSGQSGFTRIYRGYYVYDDYSILEKILGNDSPSAIHSHIRHCPVSFMFEGGDMYFNTFQHVLIRTGMIGAVLYILLFFSLYRKSDYCGKAILTVILVLGFISSMYFTEAMAIYFLFAWKRQVNKDVVLTKNSQYYQQYLAE